MAKKMMSMWKPLPQIKLQEKEAKKKSKFYFPSPDKDTDDVFTSKSPTNFCTSPEFESAREKFFRKYEIPDDGKTEFLEIFLKGIPDSKTKQTKSKRPPVHSTSSVSLTSSSRYKETRMSLPSLPTNRASPSLTRYKLSRKASEGSIGKRVPSYDDILRAETKSSSHETLIEGVTSYDGFDTDDTLTPVEDDVCIFHHRCRSTALDLPLNQFEISVGGSTTIIIADNNTIILHGQNAQLVSQHRKIALKLLFNMTDDIITRMVNSDFLEELGEIMLEKRATPLEIGKGCVEIWLSFAEEDDLEKFMDELKNGKLRDELAQLLLRHRYLKDDKDLMISIKEKKKEEKEPRDDNVFSNVEGALDPTNFMMSAYGCTDMEQLDTILACKYKNKVPFGGFSEHFHITESEITLRNEAPDTLFPTLLHFAAFHGLPNLCACLVNTPGFSQAVSMKNKDGLTPVEMVSEDKQNIKNILNNNQPS